MQAMPISSKDLGLKGLRRDSGYALIAIACIAGMMILLRFFGSDRMNLRADDWVVLSVVGVVAVRRLYVGVHILLAVLVDTVGPASIQHAEFSIKQLLQEGCIWTYEKPTRLIEKIYYRFIPSFVFLSPPYRRLVTGIVPHFLLALAACIGVVYAGPPFVLALAILTVAAIGRAIGLQLAVRLVPGVQPPVEIYEKPEHLTQAGSPIDLYSHLKRTFEQLREGLYQNRILADQPPQMGVNDGTNRFTGNLIVETQPLPVEGGKSGPAARTLDVFGVFLECVGYGIFLFASWQSLSPPMLAGTICAVAAALWYGSQFLLIAQGIHYTFRFRSDIVWLQLEGSYMLNKISVGGGLTGLPGTEGHSVKSDVTAFVRATRVTTECTPLFTTIWPQLLGTTEPAEYALQCAPRYILSARTDSVFGERLDLVVENLLHYRDDTDDLRTPDLHTPGIQDMILKGAQIHQLLNVAAVQGQQQALGTTLPQPTGQQHLASPTPPLGLPSAHSQPTASPTASPAATPATRPVQRASPPASGSTARQAPPPPPPPGKAKSSSPAPANSRSAPSGGSTPTHWPCKKCQRRLIAPAQLAGTLFECPHCKSQQIVPRASQ